MTAIIAIRLPERIHLFADAAHYYENGIVSHFGSKIHEIAGGAGALAVSGKSALPSLLLDKIAARQPFWDFDDAVTRLPDELAQLEREVLRVGDYPAAGNYLVLLAGWSIARTRPEVWHIVGSQTDGCYRDAPKLTMIEDGWRFVAGPMFLQGDRGLDPHVAFSRRYKRFLAGQVARPEFDSLQQIVPVFESMRLGKSTGQGKYAVPEPIHMVGGFVEEVVLDHSGVAGRKIIRTWSDRVGQRILSGEEERAIDAGHAHSVPASSLSATRVQGAIEELDSEKQAADDFLDSIAALTDPNEDRILFWDDSDGDFDWLGLSGLSISGNTLSVIYGTGTGTAAQGNDSRIVNAVQSTDVGAVVLLADQAAYDALDPPVATTLYLVPEE